MRSMKTQPVAPGTASGIRPLLPPTNIEPEPYQQHWKTSTGFKSIKNKDNKEDFAKENAKLASLLQAHQQEQKEAAQRHRTQTNHSFIEYELEQSPPESPGSSRTPPKQRANRTSNSNSTSVPLSPSIQVHPAEVSPISSTIIQSSSTIPTVRVMPSVIPSTNPGRISNSMPPTSVAALPQPTEPTHQTSHPVNDISSQFTPAPPATAVESRKERTLRLDAEADHFHGRTGEEIRLTDEIDDEEDEMKEEQSKMEADEEREVNLVVDDRIEKEDDADDSPAVDAEDDEARLNATLSLALALQRDRALGGNGSQSSRDGRRATKRLTSTEFEARLREQITTEQRLLDADHPYHPSKTQQQRQSYEQPQPPKQLLLTSSTRNSSKRSSLRSHDGDSVMNSNAALAAELSFDNPIPPATMRLYPPQLIAEVDEAHQQLSQFIQKCQFDTRFLKEDPPALIQVYYQNFLQLLTTSGLDSHGYPTSTTSTSASSLIPAPHLTLCASYILVKLCESGIFTSYQSDLLMKLLNTLLFAVYDISYETSGTNGNIGGRQGGTGPVCKRTPFFTRYKHLQMAFQDVETYRIRTENRLRYNLNSLRMVISHANRRFSHLCFRAWLYEVKISKKRNKIYHLTMKKKNEPAQDNEIVSVFFFWRAYARNLKLQRLFNQELSKLNDILAKIQTESIKTTATNTTLAENIQMLALKLSKLEDERLSAPIKPDVYFTNTFMENLFTRCTRELEIMKDLTGGFVPLYRLAPKYIKKIAQLTQSQTSTSTTPPDIGLATDSLLKQLPNLSRKHQWASRSTLFQAIEQQRLNEEAEEMKYYQELSLMEVEDFLVLWTNYLLGHTQPNALSSTTTTPRHQTQPPTPISSTTSPTSKSSTSIKRRLRDLSTDLRDSGLYVQLLQVLGPELPTHKVEKLFDLHSKAKLILSLSAMMGCRIVITEFEYVEGIPDLHLLFLGSIFQCRHGLGSEPKQKWFEQKANRIASLREHWNHIKSMENVPPVTAYSYMGHLYQLSTEIDVLKSRLLRRQTFHHKLRTRVKNFMWSIQRARVSGIEEEFYHVKHINNKYHNYIESGTIEQLLNSDPVRIKHRLKYEHKQLGATAGMQGLTKKERLRLVLDDEEEIEQEITSIKRVFANNRIELKKIFKHYSMDPQTNEVHEGIDFESFLSFCKDCGFLGGQKVSLTHLHGIFHTCLLPIEPHQPEEDDKPTAPTKEPLAIKSKEENSPVDESSSEIPSDTVKPSISIPTTSPLPPHPRLTPSQFLDTIIRIANIKYLTVFSDHLSLRVQECVEKDVLVGACRTVVDEFRKQLASESVRNVFKAHKGKLSALFRRYSTMDVIQNSFTLSTPTSSASSTLPTPPPPHDRTLAMDFQQFMELMRDAKLVDTQPNTPKQLTNNSPMNHPTLPLQRFQLLFRNVQQDEDYGIDLVSTNSSSASELLSYQEWLECLASLSCWFYPDPFMTQATKIDLFLQHILFASLKQTAEEGLERPASSISGRSERQERRRTIFTGTSKA